MADQGPRGLGYPPDRALGIGAKDPCSPWVRQAAAHLAQAHPFRQAGRLLSKMIGCIIDHRRLWGWAQTSGGRVREEQERRRARLFRDGELPGGGGARPPDRLHLRRRDRRPLPGRPHLR